METLPLLPSRDRPPAPPGSAPSSRLLQLTQEPRRSPPQHPAPSTTAAAAVRSLTAHTGRLLLRAARGRGSASSFGLRPRGTGGCSLLRRRPTLRAAAGAAVLQANLIHTHRHGQLGDFRSVRLIIPIASILSKSAIFVIVMKTQRAHSRTSWVAKHQHLCSQPNDTASVGVQRRNHHLGLQPQSAGPGTESRLHCPSSFPLAHPAKWQTMAPGHGGPATHRGDLTLAWPSLAQVTIWEAN